jgi:hypothetical protein
MQAVKEITKWEDGNSQINHTYLLEGDQMVAYIRFGHSDPYYFKKPIRIDRRGRKFEELTVNPFAQPVASQLREVKGSKGDTYYVDDEAHSCTCPGYTYRGTCKHVTG